MCVHGDGSGCDLVKQMQPHNDLQTTWIIFYHVKHLEVGRHSLAMCMIPFYYKAMMIAICDMQIEDTKA
jgi:hypothetical protein